MSLLGLALVFSLFSWFYMAAVLVPARQEKAALLAVSLAAVVNVGLNWLLIPAYQATGAAAATLLADIAACAACCWLAKKEARLLPSWKKLASSLLGCLYVYLVCQLLWPKIGPGATVFWPPWPPPATSRSCTLRQPIWLNLSTDLDRSKDEARRADNFAKLSVVNIALTQ